MSAGHACPPSKLHVVVWAFTSLHARCSQRASEKANYNALTKESHRESDRKRRVEAEAVLARTPRSGFFDLLTIQHAKDRTNLFGMIEYDPVTWRDATDAEVLHAKTVLANDLERERRAEYRKFQQQHPPPPPPPAAVELKCTKCASHSPATMWYPISDPPICAGWLTQAVPLSTQPAGPHAVRCAEGPNLRYRTVDGEVLYGTAES